MKRLLEEAARREKQSISALLEKIVASSLRDGFGDSNQEEEALQNRLHAEASKWIGRINSGRTDRSRRVCELVRRKLRSRRERARTH